MSTLDNIFKQIKEKQNILICINNNIHALNAGLILQFFIKNLYKKVDIICPEKIPHNKIKHYSFPIIYDTKLNSIYISQIGINIDKNIPISLKYNINNEHNRLELLLKTKKQHINTRDLNIINKNFNYDLIITINISNLKELGSIYGNNLKFFKQTTIINIDNNPNNNLFGNINFVDINTNLISEHIYNLYKIYLNQKLNNNIAEILLTDIFILDQKENIKIKYSSLIQECIKLGADYHKIKENLFYKKDTNYIKLLANALKNVEINNNILTTQINLKYQINDNFLNNYIEDLLYDILKHIKNIAFIIISIEKLDKWQHLLYTVRTDISIKKIQEKFQVLNSNKDIILIETELRDLNNIYKDFYQILSNI